LKLTNSESIQESEKEFIDTINAELDWDAIEQLLLDRHGFSVQEDVDYKDGNLIVHNNEIAYKFDFEIKVPLSVIFNREGECLEMTTRSTDEILLEDVSNQDKNPLDQKLDLDKDASDQEVLEKSLEKIDSSPTDSSEEMPGMGLEKGSEIADMISEINSEINNQGE